MIQVEINNQQSTLAIDQQQFQKAVVDVLQAAGRANASVSVAIVDDPTMHELNRQYLSHDYPTDVLSFLLEEDEDELEGEVIVSADTAARIGPEYGASPQQELLHYLIHGCLHLVGHDDHDVEKLKIMREQESVHLKRFGMEPNFKQRDSARVDRERVDRERVDRERVDRARVDRERGVQEGGPMQ